eukprot:TRINITY_DN59308_c0_g1_i1.p1 TRINITY_DN59308_c0_g1~~TRINITY_DN59308_c0_g1_i1.p1  ORF type:complete len:219 (-),score=49.44 TRINITY_DN59308_c0_g1_i1:43-699(-)
MMRSTRGSLQWGIATASFVFLWNLRATSVPGTLGNGFTLAHRYGAAPSATTGFAAVMRSQGGSLFPRMTLRCSGHFNELTVDQLKKELKSRGLRTTGKKAELVERLQLSEESSNANTKDHDEDDHADVDDDGDDEDENDDEYEDEEGNHDDDGEHSLDAHVETYLDQFTTKQLKQHLKRHGLPTSGSREELIERAWADYYNRRLQHYREKHPSEPTRQ